MICDAHVHFFSPGFFDALGTQKGLPEEGSDDTVFSLLGWDPPESVPALAAPQDIPLNILHEDDDLLVVDKEPGMVVHPAPGNPDGTLVNALLHHCRGRLSGIGGVERPGIVHRLDKDTSGLLLLTDVAGVLDKDKNLISELSIEELPKLIENGTITGGMIPKVESAAAVVESGVEGVIILDGRVPHSVLLELLTPLGVGTRISRAGA